MHKILRAQPQPRRQWPGVGSKVKWRHQARDHSIRHMPFSIGGLLELSLYISNRFRDIRTNIYNEHINERTNQPTNTYDGSQYLQIFV